MKAKEKTIVYKTKDCEHLELKKMAPLWFVCKKCGKIFNIPFSLQYDYQMAVEQLTKVIIGIKENEALIKNGEAEIKKKEKEEEKKAIGNYKKSRKVIN
jgi:hypothetical protein